MKYCTLVIKIIRKCFYFILIVLDTIACYSLRKNYLNYIPTIMYRPSLKTIFIGLIVNFDSKNKN